ncbi:MAG TPA: methionyl-tRNA formyltransferase [Candidatus Paceibacterota bacterium]|nr:methionyl-tRNA formyltransferase [Candidatus Paceibacterota bacterium]
MNAKPNIAFFGTPERAVIALEGLKAEGVLPSLIVTQPDRPQGRKMIVTPPAAKVWAEKHNIPVLQPDTLDAAFADELRRRSFDVFVVVAYGKIMKEEILSIPRFGSINLHASLLPKLRGSSPVESAILTNEKNTGVTVIRMDRLMDHGPILAQKAVHLATWPIPADDLARVLVEEGAKLLAETVRALMNGTVSEIEQDHNSATYTKKITKEDGLIDLAADPYQNFLKWNAYKGWPGSYFFIEKDGKKSRVIVTDASYENGAFIVKKVISEGKKEVSWDEFRRTNPGI